MPSLPNMGIEPEMHEPVNIDHLFKDPQTQDLDVEVMITTEDHIKIIWTVGRNTQGQDVHRQLHVVREVGSDHLTNWGPYTVTAVPEALTAPRVLVKRMSFAQRRALEAIAAKTEVGMPDGQWGCRSWVHEVIEGATREKLLTALDAAQVLASVDRHRLRNN